MASLWRSFVVTLTNSSTTVTVPGGGLLNEPRAYAGYTLRDESGVLWEIETLTKNNELILHQPWSGVSGSYTVWIIPNGTNAIVQQLNQLAALNELLSNANRELIVLDDADPTVGLGRDGALAIDTTRNLFFGPKAAGAWPAGVSLVGPSASPLTTKGDLFTYSTTTTRLGVGANGQILCADSSQPAGLVWKNTREILTANRTYYVRTDGNDGNTGLTNDAGGAFATISKPLENVSSIDFNGFVVTIQVGPGTYNGPFYVPSCVGTRNASSLVLSGDTTTPTNVQIVSAGGYQGGFTGNNPNCMFSVKGFHFTGSVDHSRGVMVTIGALAQISGNCTFGAHTGSNSAHLCAEFGGILDLLNTSYIVNGGAGNWIRCTDNSIVRSFGSGVVTFSGTPNWISEGVHFSGGGYVNMGGSVLSGAATGKRYTGNLNGACQVFGAGENFIPGNVAGTVTAGAQYA